MNSDWYQALFIVEALLRISPDMQDAIALRARLLYQDEGNANEALAVLADAETRFPQNPAFPELRGMILLDAGLKDQAAAELQRALALDPTRLGTLTELLGQSVAAAAWTDAESYLARIPDADRTPDILRMGWQVAEGLGNHDQAILYARAIGASGQAGAADEAAVREIRSLLAAEKASDARARADSAMAAAGTAQVRSTLRTLRAAAGSDDPLSDLRLALRDDPDNGEALAAISTALEQQGDLRKAAEYARHAAELAPRDPAIAARAADLAARAAGAAAPSAPAAGN